MFKVAGVASVTPTCRKNIYQNLFVVANVASFVPTCTDFGRLGTHLSRE